MASLLIQLMLGLTILITTSSQAENDFGSCSSEIKLTIEQRKQHDDPTYNVYCKSRKKTFDDSAEFLVDGLSREHLLIIKNRCFDRKKQECSFDYCECDPILNRFNVKFKIDYLKIGQTFGCLIRLRDDATGNVLTMLKSNKFNGTDFVPDECNVKVIGETSNSSSPTGNIGNDTGFNLAMSLLISVVAVLTLILLSFFIKWCQRSKCLGSKTERSTEPIEPKQHLLTPERKQKLLENNVGSKCLGSKTERSTEPIELKQHLLTPERKQKLLEKIVEKIIACVKLKDAVKNPPEQNLEELLRQVKVIDMDLNTIKEEVGNTQTSVLSEGINVIEMDLNTIKEEVGNTQTSVLSEGINAIQTELTAITVKLNQALSRKIDVDAYFAFKCEHKFYDIVYFYEGKKTKHEQGQGLQHEQEQELQLGKKQELLLEIEQELQHEQMLQNERILDMCFVEHDAKLCLVYIDADNKLIVRQHIIPENGRMQFVLNEQPNRLSKINEDIVAVIYKKRFEVLIFNVKDMEKENTMPLRKYAQNIIDPKNGIQGILALSKNEFILSDKMHFCVWKLKQNEPIVKNLQFDQKVEFDTARRLTHAITSDEGSDIIFIADENDKRITSIIIPPQDEDKENITGNVINQQGDHNRGLQNVRAIVATRSRIYAATSAGISVFCHDNGSFQNWGSGENSEGYKMLVEYKEHVEHTRGLCLHKFREYTYIGISCIIKQKDVILVFKLKPDSKNVFE